MDKNKTDETKSLKIRSIAYMFCSTVESSTIKKLNEIITFFEETLNPIEIAGILHDKDTNTEPHFHIIIRFKNAVWLSSIISKLKKRGFDVQSNFFETWSGKVNNAYSYLIHHTADAKDKYQYSCDEVIANFDYASLIEKIESSLTNNKNEKNSIRDLINKIISGEMTYEDAIKSIDGYTLVKYDREFTKARKRRTEIEFEKWRENVRENGFKREIIWLYGSSGTGKSRLSKDYAEALGKPYFITGSSNDRFQNIKNQETVIIEEIRPARGGNFNYADFLLIIDPFNIEATAASRYFDKPLIASTIIINTPFSPLEFYNVLSKQRGFDKNIDTITQLIRRITLLQEITKKSIITYRFDNNENQYLEYERIDNPYFKPDKEIVEFNSETYNKFKKVTLKIKEQEHINDRKND